MLAGLLTAYTAVDMIMYNKKRSAEWAEAQKKLEADSLEAARIAYMTGKADAEQIALVEEQLERERESGRKTSFFKDVSVLGTPESPSTPSSPAAATPTESQFPPPPPSEQPPQPDQPQQQKSSSLWSWLTSNLKREEEEESTSSSSPSSPLSSQPRLGYESLDDDSGAAGGAVRDSDLVRAVEGRQAQVQAKASAAVARERENQRRGGPLDRVGVVEGADGGADGAGAGAAVGEGEGEAPKEKKKKTGWFW